MRNSLGGIIGLAGKIREPAHRVYEHATHLLFSSPLGLSSRSLSRRSYRSPLSASLFRTNMHRDVTGVYEKTRERDPTKPDCMHEEYAHEMSAQSTDASGGHVESHPRL